jgi:uncharacterized membrane protein
MISAQITLTVPELSQTGDSVDVTIKSNESETVSFSGLSTITQDAKSITFTTPSDVSLTADTEQTITIDYIVDDDFDFRLEEAYSTTLTATGTTNPEVSTQLVFEKDFCSVDNLGNLEISNIEFDVLEGLGDDEDFWYPLDEIELSFDVENRGDWDIDNIEIEICVFDENEETCVFDEDDFDLSDDDFNLDPDDDEINVKATLIVDPDELKAGNTDYNVYIKARGDIDDSDALENDGEPTCISDSENIDIRTDEEFIIFSDITFDSVEPIPCGTEVTLEFDVWNVGDKDLDDDEVYIWIYNKDLGLDEEITFRSGIDKLDMEPVSLTFEVPKNIDEKTYGIFIRAYDDKTFDNNDLYENEEEDESEVEVPLRIEGSCALDIEEPRITAELDSETPEAVAGEQIIIKATITNNADEEAEYTISISGNSAWSSLVDISPKTITLGAGESEDVEIILDLDAAISGDQEFTIKAEYNEQSSEQKVALTVKGAGTAGVTGAAIGTHIRQNAFIYAIVLINIILIIAIISVVRRMASGPQITA